MLSKLPRTVGVPRRTAIGQAELARRGRGLTQRQRTMLFLVDGRRGLADVLLLAAQAGADSACFDELVALELVSDPFAEPAQVDTSVMPSSLSLQGDSRWSAFGDDGAGRVDRPLHEARALLLRAVRAEAPLTGSLTLLKLRRAATREALERLLDEVEQRLRKPHRQIIAAQTMRHVRHLLSLPATSQPPLG